MEIFRHRPLFLACTVFLLATLAGFFLPVWGQLIAGGVTAAFALALCLWKAKRREVIPLLIAAAALLLALGGLLRANLWLNGKGTVSEICEEGKTVTVTGIITDSRSTGSFMTSYAMELTSVNGGAVKGRVLLTCHYVSDLRPGYAVSMEATVLSLEEAAGEGYDALALMGDGYRMGLLSDTEETVTITAENRGGLGVRAGALRRALAAQLNALTPDASGLPSALLLGDKTALADTAKRDFARAGVSHLLAISGLHMTLLFGLLESLLRLFRVAKRGRALLLSLCALGYLILLGFPPSATRAVIMLGAVYLSHLLSARADPLTSLGLAGALILAVTPYAAADAGFWMSYLATLGLVTLMPALNRKLTGKQASPSLPSRVRTGCYKLGAGVVVGLVAMSFTLPIVAAVIGEMGLLSPLSTLLLTPLCGAVLILSVLAIPFSGSGFGVILGRLTDGLCGLMLRGAERMGEPSLSVVSLRHPASVPIALCMLGAVLILLAVKLPEKRKWTVILPMLAGWVALGGVLGIHALTTAGDMTVTFVQPSSQADMLVLTEGNGAVICDLSNGSLTAINSAVREAEREGATEIAVLMLTHYHSRTAGTLSAVLSRETVRALWLPIPDTEEDYYLLLSYLEKAEEAGVPVTLYGEGETVTLFGGCRVVAETAYIKRSVQPILLLSLDTGRGGRAVYCGSAVFESELADKAADLISDADTVIFGNHGPRIQASFGEDLTLKRNAAVVLSAEGDTAGWFLPTAIDGQRMWLGNWKGSMKIGGEK